MYYIQDAHSFWDWIYFVLLIVIGSFFMINLCLVVIATQFSETKKRELERMKQERARYAESISTLGSMTQSSEPTNCYNAIIKYLAHMIRKWRRRVFRAYVRYRRRSKIKTATAGAAVTTPSTVQLNHQHQDQESKTEDEVDQVNKHQQQDQHKERKNNRATKSRTTTTSAARHATSADAAAAAEHQLQQLQQQHPAHSSGSTVTAADLPDPSSRYQQPLHCPLLVTSHHLHDDSIARPSVTISFDDEGEDREDEKEEGDEISKSSGRESHKEEEEVRRIDQTICRMKRREEEQEFTTLSNHDVGNIRRKGTGLKSMMDPAPKASPEKSDINSIRGSESNQVVLLPGPMGTTSCMNGSQHSSSQRLSNASMEANTGSTASPGSSPRAPPPPVPPAVVPHNPHRELNQQQLQAASIRKSNLKQTSSTDKSPGNSTTTTTVSAAAGTAAAVVAEGLQQQPPSHQSHYIATGGRVGVVVIGGGDLLSPRSLKSPKQLAFDPRLQFSFDDDPKESRGGSRDQQQRQQQPLLSSSSSSKHEALGNRRSGSPNVTSCLNDQSGKGGGDDHAIDLMGQDLMTGTASAAVAVVYHPETGDHDRHRSAPNVLMSETSFAAAVSIGSGNPHPPPAIVDTGTLVSSHHHPVDNEISYSDASLNFDWAYESGEENMDDHGRKDDRAPSSGPKQRVIGSLDSAAAAASGRRVGGNEVDGQESDSDESTSSSRSSSCSSSSSSSTESSEEWKSSRTCMLIYNTWCRMTSAIKVVVDHSYFQRFIFLSILINAIAMGIEYHNQPVELTRAVEISNTIFTFVFALEMVFKILGIGCYQYLIDGFNLFDGIVVIVSFLELFADEQGSGLSVLRTFRLLRILKLVRFMPALKRQLMIMLKTLDNVAVFFALLVLFIFIFR